MTALEFVKDIVAKDNADGKEVTSNDVLEWLCDNEIHSEVVDSHRWWNSTFNVAKYGDILIGFDYAETTGDETPWEKGFEFDESSVCYVEAVEKTVVVTEYVVKS